MRLGIVGHEAAKFTADGEQRARAAIRHLIERQRPDAVISGACHLGGIDIWAVEEARALGVPTVEYAPKVLHWSKPGGFKERNLRIASESDAVVSIVVDRLPETYSGMRFANCYHCGGTDHVKSGGCWTMKQALKMGKEGAVLIINQ